MPASREAKESATRPLLIHFPIVRSMTFHSSRINISTAAQGPRAALGLFLNLVDAFFVFSGSPWRGHTPRRQTLFGEKDRLFVIPVGLSLLGPRQFFFSALQLIRRTHGGISELGIMDGLSLCEIFCAEGMLLVAQPAASVRPRVAAPEHGEIFEFLIGFSFPWSSKTINYKNNRKVAGNTTHSYPDSVILFVSAGQDLHKRLDES